MIKEIAFHRSIRKYKTDAIAPEVMNEILAAATRASNTGNMQLYSIVMTTDDEVKRALSPCHFGQPMVEQAPVVMTFCADINRFSHWCRLRDAEPAYDNFMWFLNAATDALLASENAALEAESHGLGICYLCTTVYNARKICDVLNLPRGVVPVTTVVMGYPDQTPELTDRLPVEAVVHYDRYSDYTDEEIDRLWAEKEASELTAQLLEQNSLPNLARIFTEKRYTKKDNIPVSKAYLELLVEQGFFNQ